MGKSVSDYMKIAWNVFGKKVVNRMVSEKTASFVGDIFCVDAKKRRL